MASPDASASNGNKAAAKPLIESKPLEIPVVIKMDLPKEIHNFTSNGDSPAMDIGLRKSPIPPVPTRPAVGPPPPTTARVAPLIPHM
jgi:hypothetical protein